MSYIDKQWTISKGQENFKFQVLSFKFART